MNVGLLQRLADRAAHRVKWCLAECRAEVTNPDVSAASRNFVAGLFAVPVLLMAVITTGGLVLLTAAGAAISLTAELTYWVSTTVIGWWGAHRQRLIDDQDRVAIYQARRQRPWSEATKAHWLTGQALADLIEGQTCWVRCLAALGDCDECQGRGWHLVPDELNKEFLFKVCACYYPSDAYTYTDMVARARDAGLRIEDGYQPGNTRVPVHQAAVDAARAALDARGGVVDTHPHLAMVGQRVATREAARRNRTDWQAVARG